MGPGVWLQSPGAKYPSSRFICSSVIHALSPPPCYLPTGVGSQTMNARRKGAARVRRSSDEPAGGDQNLPVLVGSFVDNQREIPLRHLLLRDPRLDEHADSDEFRAELLHQIHDATRRAA